MHNAKSGEIIVCGSPFPKPGCTKHPLLTKQMQNGGVEKFSVVFADHLLRAKRGWWGGTLWKIISIELHQSGLKYQ